MINEQDVKRIIEKYEQDGLYSMSNASHTHNGIDSPFVIGASQGTQPTVTMVNQMSSGTAITFTYPTKNTVRINNIGVTSLTAGTNVTISGSSGAITIYAAGGSTGTPAGADTQIQFNDSSAFGASSLMTFNKADGGNLTLAASSGTGATAGGTFSLSGGTPTGSGNYGQITLNTGYVSNSKSYTPNIGSTATLLCDFANEHRVTFPAGNIVLAVSGDTGAQKFIVSLTQDSGGSRTATWWNTIKWAGGTQPTLTTTANKRDTMGFIRTGSSTYDGFIIGQNI